MTESLLAGGLVAAMLVAAAALTASAETWVWAGLWLAVAGLVFGVPTGLVYHVELHRALRGSEALVAGWWWRPTALHPRIPRPARRRVLGWCFAGAAGFVVSVLGCVVSALGLFRAL